MRSLFLSLTTMSVFALGCVITPAPKDAAHAKPTTSAPSGRVEHFGALVDAAVAGDGTPWQWSQERDPASKEDGAKKPFSLEPFHRLKTFSTPTWSPDGSRLLFAATSHCIKTGKTTSNLYLISKDGKELRQMTATDGFNGSEGWSPDGSTIYFLSDRNDKTGLYAMPADGGEAALVAEVPTGISGPRFSQDGTFMVFVSSVFPEHGADMVGNKTLMDDLNGSHMKAHVAEHLLFRHWDHYKDGRRSHVLRMDLATGSLTDLTPGDYDSPVFALGSSGGYDVSPDGKELVFTSNREAPDAQAWTTNADLFVVSTAGGNPVNLTKTNPAWDSEPHYSPDGKSIAFLRQTRPGVESDMKNLALYDRATGDIKVLTEALDFHVTHFEWTPQGDAIVFNVAKDGRYPLYKATVATGDIAPISNIPSVIDFRLSPTGEIAFPFSRIGQPYELFAGGLVSDETIRLTKFNDDVAAEYDIRPAEELWIDGPAGRKIHTFVVKPHGFDPSKKYPLILNVHGGPQYQWADTIRGDWQIYPAAGYVVAFPNPTGSTGYGQDYTDAISKDWNGMVMKEVEAVTDHLAALDYVDEDRMGAMGWSWGGYAMNWMGGHTNRYKALASTMGIFDLRSMYYATEELWFMEADAGIPHETPEAVEAANPANSVTAMKTPTLIITGEKDYRIPYTQSLMLFTALRRQGVPSKIMVLPNDGHWPHLTHSMPLYYMAHLEWFHRYLGGDKPTHVLQEMIRGRAFD